MDRIGIDQVLNHLDIDHRSVGIRYVKENGEIGVMYSCHKPVSKAKSAPGQIRNADPRGKIKYNLKYHGVVLLKNDDSGDFRSIKKAQMIGFRPFGSDKWLPIWH